MMKKIIWFVILCAMQTPIFAAQKILLESDSDNRDQPVLYLPDNFADSEKMPLVIALHGYKGSDRLIRFQLGLSRLVDRMGFMLLTPNGTTNSDKFRFWNATNFCCDFEQTGVDDAGFIKGLVETIKNRADLGHLDENRIVVIGFSNGAFMTNRLACQFGEYIHGFVTISGTDDLHKPGAQDSPFPQACLHNKAIPMIHIHGLLDQTIPFEGTAESSDNVGHLGALEFVNAWAVQNHCDATPQADGTENAVRGKGRQDSSKFTWQNCDAPVTFYRIEQGQHFSVFRTSFIRKILKELL